MKARIRDAMGVALALLVVALVIGDGVGTGRMSVPYLLVALPLGLSTSVALWWRRRWPVGLTLLMVPLSAVSESVGGAVFVCTYTVAARRPKRVALGVYTLFILAAVPYSLVRPDPSLSFVGYHALNVVLLGVILGWGMIVRGRRERVAALREHAVRVEAEATRLAERTRGEERERIAREMHDVLAHRISLVSLHAGALEVRPDLTAEEVARAAATIRASAHQALEDLREILGILRAGHDDLQPQPRLCDLDALVAETRLAGTPVELDNRLADPDSIPPSLSRTAYRVVQEGLTNARKHAPGHTVRVQLDQTTDGELHVALRNPLATTPARIPGSRSGLVGLTERVSLAGGRIEHGAWREAPGVVAFHLEAWLPWPK